jgi:hypothetical protein
MPDTWRPSVRAAAVGLILARMSADERATIEAALAPAVREELRRGYLRLAAIDAAKWHGAADGMKPWPLAGKVRVALNRYASSGWRFERDGRPPNDPARAALWRFLQLTDGKVRSQKEIDRLLRSWTSEAVAMSMTLPDLPTIERGSDVEFDQKARRRQ